MEKNLAVLKLGIQYLYRYRRRYYFLLAALVLGFAVVTFITSTKDGMYDSVYYSAQAHYAGDIIAIGHINFPPGGFIHHLGQNEITGILNAADIAGINPQHTVFRTNIGNAAIHYNGIAIQLKYLIGSDWDGEAHLFGKMNFNQPPALDIGDDGIILSVPVAGQLGAKMGDRVILELDTRFGQKNTGQFIVKGIVHDTSIFGFYKAYISRLTLNRLVLFDDNDCSSIGFFLDNPGLAGQKRIRLQEHISAHLQTGPLVYDREEMVRERDRPLEGNRIFLYTLPVYLSEIADLLDTMNIITYLVYGMMLIIIFVSAAVTYRLILHERSREIGIMRTIGFCGGDLRLVLWTEIAVMGIISMVLGFFLARICGWAVSFISFSWFPGFEIFLKNEKLIAMYMPGTVLLNAILLLFVLGILALFPSFRITQKNLPGLLSGGPL